MNKSLYNSQKHPEHIHNSYQSSMYSRAVNITFPAELLKKIDADAKANFCSRSSYIRETLTLRLNNQHIVTEQSEDNYLKSLAEKFS